MSASVEMTEGQLAEATKKQPVLLQTQQSATLPKPINKY